MFIYQIWILFTFSSPFLHSINHQFNTYSNSMPHPYCAHLHAFHYWLLLPHKLVHIIYYLKKKKWRCCFIIVSIHIHLFTMIVCASNLKQIYSKAVRTLLVYANSWIHFNLIAHHHHLHFVDFIEAKQQRRIKKVINKCFVWLMKENGLRKKVKKWPNCRFRREQRKQFKINQFIPTWNVELCWKKKKNFKLKRRIENKKKI